MQLALGEELPSLEALAQVGLLYQEAWVGRPSEEVEVPFQEVLVHHLALVEAGVPYPEALEDLLVLADLPYQGALVDHPVKAEAEVQSQEVLEGLQALVEVEVLY